MPNRPVPARLTALLAVPAAIALAWTPNPTEDTDWREILGPPQGEWPAPTPELEWRDDLRAALAEARETGRPLLVTARCLPCKQCANFDKEVLEGGPTLTPLMSRFVTVRLTDALSFDSRLLPYEGFQDLDLSWWAYFLSPEGRVYGIFGGRDEVSDATRISGPAFANALRRVLDHHSDPRRAAWAVDGPAPDMDGDARGVRDEPGLSAWLESSPEAPDLEGDPSSCVHCHQLAEILRQPAIDAQTFDVVRDVAIWPYPENVGVTVDRDDGLRVTEVADGSPAARAGLRVGDSLAAAGGRRLFGQADLRGVLHRSANPAGRIDVVWRRGEDVHEGTLELEDGWRATELGWRMSISQGNIGPAPGFPFPLAGPRIDGKLTVRPFFGRAQARSIAYAAGLRPRHVIVAVDGACPDRAGREFLTWFRLSHSVGDRVVLTVLDGEEEKEIAYVLEGR